MKGAEMDMLRRNRGFALVAPWIVITSMVAPWTPLFADTSKLRQWMEDESRSGSLSAEEKKGFDAAFEAAKKEPEKLADILYTEKGTPQSYGRFFHYFANRLRGVSAREQREMIEVMLDGIPSNPRLAVALTHQLTLDKVSSTGGPRGMTALLVKNQLAPEARSALLEFYTSDAYSKFHLANPDKESNDYRVVLSLPKTAGDRFDDQAELLLTARLLKQSDQASPQRAEEVVRKIREQIQAGSLDGGAIEAVAELIRDPKVHPDTQAVLIQGMNALGRDLAAAGENKAKPALRREESRHAVDDETIHDPDNAKKTILPPDRARETITALRKVWEASVVGDDGNIKSKQESIAVAAALDSVVRDDSSTASESIFQSEETNEEVARILVADPAELVDDPKDFAKARALQQEVAKGFLRAKSSRDLGSHQNDFNPEPSYDGDFVDYQDYASVLGLLSRARMRLAMVDSAKVTAEDLDKAHKELREQMKVLVNRPGMRTMRPELAKLLQSYVNNDSRWSGAGRSPAGLLESLEMLAKEIQESAPDAKLKPAGTSAEGAPSLWKKLSERYAPREEKLARYAATLSILLKDPAQYGAHAPALKDRLKELFSQFQDDRSFNHPVVAPLLAQAATYPDARVSSEAIRHLYMLKDSPAKQDFLMALLTGMSDEQLRSMQCAYCKSSKDASSLTALVFNLVNGMDSASVNAESGQRIAHVLDRMMTVYNDSVAEYGKKCNQSGGAAGAECKPCGEYASSLSRTVAEFGTKFKDGTWIGNRRLGRMAYELCFDRPSEISACKEPSDWEKKREITKGFCNLFYGHSNPLRIPVLKEGDTDISQRGNLQITDPVKDKIRRWVKGECGPNPAADASENYKGWARWSSGYYSGDRTHVLPIERLGEGTTDPTECPYDPGNPAQGFAQIEEMNRAIRSELADGPSSGAVSTQAKARYLRLLRDKKIALLLENLEGMLAYKNLDAETRAKVVGDLDRLKANCKGSENGPLGSEIEARIQAVKDRMARQSNADVDQRVAEMTDSLIQDPQFRKDLEAYLGALQSRYGPGLNGVSLNQKEIQALNSALNDHNFNPPENDPFVKKIRGSIGTQSPSVLVEDLRKKFQRQMGEEARKLGYRKGVEDSAVRGIVYDQIKESAWTHLQNQGQLPGEWAYEGAITVDQRWGQLERVMIAEAAQADVDAIRRFETNPRYAFVKDFTKPGKLFDSSFYRELLFRVQPAETKSVRLHRALGDSDVVQRSYSKPHEMGRRIRQGMEEQAGRMVDANLQVLGAYSCQNMSDEMLDGTFKPDEWENFFKATASAGLLGTFTNNVFGSIHEFNQSLSDRREQKRARLTVMLLGDKALRESLVNDPRFDGQFELDCALGQEMEAKIRDQVAKPGWRAAMGWMDLGTTLVAGFASGGAAWGAGGAKLAAGRALANRALGVGVNVSLGVGGTVVDHARIDREMAEADGRMKRDATEYRAHALTGEGTRFASLSDAVDMPVIEKSWGQFSYTLGTVLGVASGVGFDLPDVGRWVRLMKVPPGQRGLVSSLSRQGAKFKDARRMAEYVDRKVPRLRTMGPSADGVAKSVAKIDTLLDDPAMKGLKESMARLEAAGKGAPEMLEELKLNLGFHHTSQAQWRATGAEADAAVKKTLEELQKKLAGKTLRQQKKILAEAVEDSQKMARQHFRLIVDQDGPFKEEMDTLLAGMSKPDRDAISDLVTEYMRKKVISGATVDEIRTSLAAIRKMCK